ncbi:MULTISPECIES: nitrite reductase small subunit NirD [Rugamonas]|jgi:nitrite reductase (NADH) small subunit|uniref:Nitrite reductase (NADH) small subunit n=1 Tax=Rugamonas rubra TaxID=758825 RepID=A0A1I4UD74_9BURK|nr:MULTISPECIES: nitrite reductase small subunit NirD [Rugamonas]PHV04836.1 nitrite reductase (NAD(P)H) small subunit [Janthinobacterium sp. BJB412]WGG50969.1 nitrite reductase small subunit NirD [Rugamonas sp. DEMB1]SFM86791.1 nitrite reductase (NADH) small subunit [Rugamonas rubra]
MHRDMQTDKWIAVCDLAEIVPNTGVCALLNEVQVAVFHLDDNGTPRVFAIENYDPNSQAAVLSRGLVGSLGERIVVASPIYKQHFDLQTGECLEAPENSVGTYPARIAEGKVWVGV